MKLNTPFGRVMYALSLVVSVAMIASFWLFFDQPLIVKVLLTLFVIGIGIWNGKLAFGSKTTS
jgi:hypothetical protein